VSYAQELLETAKGLLLGQNGEGPSRADCNRAASTIYYALFDCLCNAIGNRIVGNTNEQPTPSDAWTTVYRHIDHAALEAALFRVKFPNQDIETFSKIIAATFKRGRDERTKADYNRAQDVDLDAAKQLLTETRNVIFLIEDPDAIGFDSKAWLSSLIIELFFSRTKR
jgi:uncharacterized protein (UPF0332 family)